jgi:hypothetical protein
LPSDQRTVTTPPRLLIDCSLARDVSFDGVAAVVVVVLLRAAVVVVVDLRVVEVVDPGFFDDDLSVVTVVGVEGRSDPAVTEVVVDGAGGAAALTRVPAVAPGRGSELPGGACAGDDVDSAEGLAGAASTGGDGEGAVVSGVGAAAAANSSAAAGADRAACRARRTSGRDIGCTPAVAKRDETSCTPKSPRSTPEAVPRAHVTTRTLRIRADGAAGDPIRA